MHLVLEYGDMEIMYKKKDAILNHVLQNVDRTQKMF